jgi:hypothetical protein
MIRDEQRNPVKRAADKLDVLAQNKNIEKDSVLASGYRM